MGVAAGPATARELRVRLLGGFMVEGQADRSLGTRKARILLKRLAVASGRPVPADELAAAVWGEGLPKNPSDQVSVLVSRLRSVLGAHRLPRSDAGYSLVADWFDLVELESCVDEIEERLRDGEKGAALAAAHAALGLTRGGGLLPEEDGDWVEEARPAADRLVARARLLAAEAALGAGELGAARAAAQSVLDHDPYDETALRLVMRANTLAGCPGDALAAYALVRHQLSEDLGVDPAPETESLHTAIVRGEVPRLSDVEAAPPVVVGRDIELDLLDGVLASVEQGPSKAVVVEAEAGMGKSALLSAWLARPSASALVISGRCDELVGDLPLQPVVDGLAAHLEVVGRKVAAELVGADASLLDPLLGRASMGPVPGVTTVADAAASRARLFAAFSDVLHRSAGSRSLVLVVDDLHLADPGTAEFLAFALRRMPRTMVLTSRRPETGPDLPAAKRIVLRPLSLADAVALVGADRGPTLYERSAGHPLFLRELAEAVDAELPASIVAAVQSQLDRLGGAAASVQAAAACGTEVDAALIAAITRRSVPEVLDDLEQAARAHMLRPRGAALVFSHELVREAVEARTSPPRRREIHRAAVDELARRTNADPLALARHARLGGDPAVAARALVAAAAGARERFEVATAELLLDQAVELCDSVAARLARGRLRLARLDLGGGREDALQSIALGGVEGFELAGWVAYYGRDYDTALRYADEGVERSTEADVRASCLGLAGRIRHTRGHLADAATQLEEAVAIAPPGVRGMVQIWHGLVLVHRGEPEKATDTARRGLLDPHLAHPFAASHGLMTIAHALGMSGHWAAALDAVDELDTHAARQGDRRFPPVAANFRGWLLRGVGLLEEAIDLHRFASDTDPGPTFQEARFAALVDLIECHLAAGDVDQAATAAKAASGVMEWTGSMCWRHRCRFRLLTDRIASLSGDHDNALADAEAVASEADERGDRRYYARALLIAAAIEGRSGRATDFAAVGQQVEQFVPVCGPDGWRDLAELAVAVGSDQIWNRAEMQAAAILAGTSARPGFDADRAAYTVRAQLDRLEP